MWKLFLSRSVYRSVTADTYYVNKNDFSYNPESDFAVF